MSASPTIFTPTSEQQSAIELAQIGNSFKIMAYAGSGKTTTLEQIGHALPSKRGLYLAFNKTIASSAQQRFPKHIDCRTFHSLAYRSVPRELTAKLSLPRLSPSHLADSYQLKSRRVRRQMDNHFEPFTLTANRQANLIIQAVHHFCTTSSSMPAARHVQLPSWIHDDDAKELQRDLFPFVAQRWQDALNPQHNAGISHDIYLKAWALTNPQIPADLILFDEAQDADPIMLGVLLKQNTQVVYVGDPHQQIYAWRGAVNAMHQLPLPETRLTQSFRFGTPIADVANIILRELGETLPLTGNLQRTSQVTRKSAQQSSMQVYLCRSNAQAMTLLIQGLSKGHRVAWQADTDRLLRFIQAAERLKSGKTVHDVPELAWFSSWMDVLEYAETPQGGDLKSLTRLIDQHGTNYLMRALKQVSHADDANYLISTVHKAKGLEWGRVQLENDFNYQLIHNRCSISDEELRLLYVAATRAMQELNIHHIESLLQRLADFQVTNTAQPVRLHVG